MLTTLLSCLLSLAFVAQDAAPEVTTKPAPQDATGNVLDQLIAKTNELKSFEASYQLTTSKPEDEALLLIFYEAPDRLRIDRLAKAGGGSSMWCVGGVITLQAHGENARHGAVDYAPVVGTMSGFQSVFQQHFPQSRALVGRTGAFVNVRWWFDEKTSKANYLAEALWSENRAAVLGWLDTLRSKQVAPQDDGERLAYDTDNAFHVVISKQTGFLEQLDGKSPGGEMHLKLTALAVDKPIEASHFGVQAGVTDGQEISDDLRRNITRNVQSAMRDGVYSVIASAPAGPAWDEATKANIAAVLGAFHECTIHSTLESWRETARKKRDGVAARLAKLLTEGKTPEEVAELREKELGFLEHALDDLRTGFTTRVSVPSLVTPLPRGAELLAIETEVIGKTFDVLVRAPTVADFMQATEPKTK